MDSRENIRIACGELEYAFTPGGMPAEMRLPAEFGRAGLLAGPASLKITLEGGRELFAVPGGSSPERWTSSRTGAAMLEYPDLAFADGNGAPEPGLRLTLR